MGRVQRWPLSGRPVLRFDVALQHIERRAAAAHHEVAQAAERWLAVPAIGEITSAALEQSSGIGQVHEAVTQMDQVTQQNAALVEQSAAAAASLKEQAGALTKSVAVFRLA